MDTPKYKTKKLAIIGVTAGLVAGAGAGLLMNLPGGASAKSPVAVSATGTDGDTGTSSDAPASSINGEMEGQHHGGRHGMDPAKMEAHVREDLQALVDAGTIDASDVDAIVAALATPPATPPTNDGTRPERGAMLTARLQSLVDDGTLTAAQLEAVVAALEAGRPDHGPGMGHGGHRRGMRGEMLTAAADAIGITADELKTEIQAGKTIAEVAVENGKTAQDVIDALVATASADLTQRITDLVNGVHNDDAAPATPATGA
ncbi:MAG: hypothetical protein ACO3AT_04430 [Ilumatobacteraceae bacterium]